MSLMFSRGDADVFVPGGGDAEQALGRTTHLCVAAHQDDIEIMAHSAIAACYESAEAHFTGVVVTDGAGSPRSGPFAGTSDADMLAIRRQEQRTAAELGKYNLQLQLAHPSVVVKAHPASPDVLGDLGTILCRCCPQELLVHSPADKHDTHVAVLLRCVEALRALPAGQRPRRLLGCEVWRDLDWLLDDDRVALDAGQRPELAEKLLQAFASQIAGGKRYDLAALGRRAANATFATPRQTDRYSGIVWAMDLTPLLHDDALTVSDLVSRHLDRFAADIADRLRRLS